MARKNLVGVPRYGFVNPYPWMSSIEAMIHLELEKRQVPFSWRYFDGESKGIKALLPDYAPEFTLREYRVVIVILGNFWGNIPGVIDRNALAFALLEQEGWKGVFLFESDIRRDPGKALEDALPQLAKPVIVGAARPNPYGAPALMLERLRRLRSQSFSRTIYRLENRGDTSRTSGRRRRNADRRERVRRSTTRSRRSDARDG